MNYEKKAWMNNSTQPHKRRSRALILAQKPPIL
jgi:hypothetical protein